MKCGDRVEILHSKYFGIKLVGLKGTICKMYYGNGTYNIGVKIDGRDNARSSCGAYYFNASQVKLLEGETNMDTIMDGNYSVAKVRFLDNDRDCNELYACYDESAEVGAICVVKPLHHPYALAKITSIMRKDAVDKPVKREIVCVADFTAYNQRVETRQRKLKLMLDMKSRAAKLQEVALFEMLAKDDPEMAELLKEYKEVSGHERKDL